MIVLVGVFIAVGLLCVILGFLMWRYRMVELVAGYEPRRVRDPEGLARWIGINLIFLGILIIFDAILVLLLPALLTSLLIATGVLVLIMAARMAFGTKRYER